MQPARYYRIRAGEIEAFDIPPDGIEIELSRRMDYKDRERAMPGAEHPHAGWTLARVAEIADRVTPWVTWHLAPNFRDSESWGGRAHVKVDHIVLKTCVDPVWTLRAALHEAYHALEHAHAISLSEREAMDRAVERGVDWPDPDYTATAVERRARLFENFGAAMLEGRRPRAGWLARQMMSHEDRLMHDILDGTIALRWAGSGGMPRSLMSDALRQRLAERPATAKAWDLGRHAIRAIWSWVADTWRPDVPAAPAAEPVAAKEDPLPAAMARLEASEARLDRLPETATASVVGAALDDLAAAWREIAAAHHAEA